MLIIILVERQAPGGDFECNLCCFDETFLFIYERFDIAAAR
jgi:hypothetical protein